MPNLDWNVLNNVMVLFLILVIGYFSKKKGYIDARVSQGLTDLLLNITVPAAILYSFSMPFSSEMLLNASVLFFLSLFLHAGFFALGKFAFKRHPVEQGKVLRMAATFSNCAFMGFPVMQGIFGNTGIFYTSIYLIPFNIVIFSLGVVLYSGDRNVKGIVKSIMNPSIFAVILGLTIFSASLSYPAPIEKTLNMIGSMTSPLSMIIIGAILADCKFSEVFKTLSVYYGAFIRLILAPLITYGLCKLLGLNDIVMQISVILQAMPVAALTTILAEKYGGDASYASKSVFISTIFSVITIPLIVSMIR